MQDRGKLTITRAKAIDTRLGLDVMSTKPFGLNVKSFLDLNPKNSCKVGIVAVLMDEGEHNCREGTVGFTS